MLMPVIALISNSRWVGTHRRSFLGKFNIEMMELTPFRYFCKDSGLPEEVAKPDAAHQFQKILA